MEDHTGTTTLSAATDVGTPFCGQSIRYKLNISLTNHTHDGASQRDEQLTLADTGARVLLVDGDLRKPSVARTMGLQGGVGLTTILLGRAAVHDAVQKCRDSQ